jgi:hypothetical protein
LIDWNCDKIKVLMEKKQKTFLHKVGQATVNQMAEFAHVKTGTLKNSMNYRLSTGSASNFGTETGPGGKGATPPESAKMDNASDKDYVRCGSNLVYAGPQEKHNAWASKTKDELVASKTIVRLAENTFK